MANLPDTDPSLGSKPPPQNKFSAQNDKNIIKKIIKYFVDFFLCKHGFLYHDMHLLNESENRTFIKNLIKDPSVMGSC